MIQPIRLRLSRAAGFDLQALSRETNGLPARVVSRPSAWGNPYRIGEHGLQSETVEAFRVLVERLLAEPDYLPAGPQARRVANAMRFRRHEIAGHNLACWCGPGACHADVLLDIATRPEIRDA